MTKITVLVDDDQDDLDVLKERIAALDSEIQCFSFRHPLEAIRALSEELLLIPDFVFTDINMPALRGDNLIKELRKNRDFDNTVITVMSTSMPVKTVTLMKEIGADYAFEKPTQLASYDIILKEIFSISRRAYGSISSLSRSRLSK